MIDAKIEAIGDGYYDLVLEGGDLVMVGGTDDTWPDLVLQDVRYALGTWFGESPFDRSAGFPWLESVFGVQPIEGIGSLLADTLIGLDTVEGLDEPPVITFDAPNYQLSISAAVKARAFEVPITLEVTAP